MGSEIKPIGILVINYNNLEYSRNCVSDLLKQINQNFDLWVVDQNSNEIGTTEYLNELENIGITVVRNKTNLDLNRVWNYFHENTKYNYLCFLNNDIRLTNNFTDDVIKIFNAESEVGVVIHVTNNLQFVKAERELNYEILNPPLYQGWDYCLRRDAYTKIPNSLRIFGGDDFIFGHLKKRGYKIALTYSSPIIHYKERTRMKMGAVIHHIQMEDVKNYHIQMKRDGYQHTNSTMTSDKCNKYPPKGMKLINMETQYYD